MAPQLLRQRGEPRAFGEAHPRRGVPAPATFARATVSASGSTSVAHTSASGSANASASASAPDPVPRSATAYAVSAPPHGSGGPTRSPGRADLGDRDLRDDLGLRAAGSARGGRRAGRCRRSSTTRARTAAARRRARRSTSSSSAAAAAHGRGRVGLGDLLGRVEPGHLFEHPAHLDAGLLDPGVAQLLLGGAPQLGPGDQRAQDPSSSWRRRSSAMSASTISSSSPAST